MSATLTIANLDRLIATVESTPEDIASMLREHLHRAEAPLVCNADDFDAHVAGTDDDGAPIYGSCSEGCTVL